jgi:hypothetical protein
MHVSLLLAPCASNGNGFSAVRVHEMKFFKTTILPKML